MTMTLNQIPNGPFVPGPVRTAGTNVSSISNLCPAFKKLLEVSYSAGVVDGEGCIVFSKTTYAGRKNPAYRLVLSISQNNHALLVRVARALDVPPRIYPIKRTPGMNRDAEVLSIADQDAHRVLMTLLPHLTRKAAEAALAIDAYERGHFRVHPGPRGHAPEVWVFREWCYKKLQRMK